MKKYKIGFDGWGLLLFLLIMLPNFIWFAVPAPNDVLRRVSVTESLDAAASVFQVLMTAALVLIVNPARKPLRLTPWTSAVIGCAALYFGGWILYYQGWTSPPVMLLLTVPPCLAFLFFAAERRNFPAMLPGGAFACCHLIYGAANFMLAP